MQYLINIDGFVVRSPLLLLATPLKSCTMESEILLQFHSILPKVVYFRMELHPIVQRRPRVAMVLVAWWCHSGSGGDVRGRARRHVRRQRHKFRHQHCRSLQYKTFLPRFKFE